MYVNSSVIIDIPVISVVTGFTGGDIDNGGGCACAVAGSAWEISVHSLNFAVNLKLL